MDDWWNSEWWLRIKDLYGADKNILLRIERGFFEPASSTKYILKKYKKSNPLLANRGLQ